MSNTLLDLGASGIIKSGDVYTFTSYRGLYLHKKKENLSNFSFKYINNEISFADTDSYKIYLQDNKFFVKTPYFQGSLDNIEQKFLNEDAKLNILLIFLGEVTSPNISGKIEYNLYKNNMTSSSKIKKACSFWDTVYNVGVGMNGAAAKANLTHNIATDMMDGDLNGCITIGAPETSTIGAVSYATKAWCCK